MLLLAVLQLMTLLLLLLLMYVVKLLLLLLQGSDVGRESGDGSIALFAFLRKPKWIVLGRF